MRVLIPEAVQVVRAPWMICNAEEHGHLSSGDPFKPSWKCVMGVYLPKHTRLVEVDPYFYNTHGRPMNDVVHSKTLVDGQAELHPNLVTSSGYIFQARATEHDHYVIDNPSEALYPHELPAPAPKFGICARYRIFNEGSESLYIDASLKNWSNAGKWWATFEWDKWAAMEKNHWSARDRTWRRRHQIQLQFESMEGAPDPFTGAKAITFSFTGRIIRIEPSGLFVKDSTIYAIAALVEGVTAYYSYHWGRFGLSGDPASSILDYMYREQKNWRLDGYMSKYKGWTGYNYVTDITCDMPELLPYRERFLLGEDLLVAEGYDPLLLADGTTRNYWRNYLVQNAYLDALDHTPRLNDNSISNILEIVGFMKSLLIDRKIDIPKSLGDAWLSYRYAYSTSKLDAEEAISFVHRHLELGTLDQWIHCFGMSSHDYHVGDQSTHIVCRCGLEIRPKDIAMLDKAWRALYTYGLQPNFYVVWDSIPYSFIVDWFIPIGNLAHALDASSMYDGTYYEIKDVVFSLSYDVEDEYHNVYHQYTRWTQDDIPQLNGFYFLEEDAASNKVIGMRILDSLSLFIGKGKGK